MFSFKLGFYMHILLDSTMKGTNFLVFFYDGF